MHRFSLLSHRCQRGVKGGGEREKERDRERETDRERERDRERRSGAAHIGLKEWRSGYWSRGDMIRAGTSLRASSKPLAPAYRMLQESFMIIDLL